MPRRVVWTVVERYLIGSALGCHIRVRTDPHVEPQHCEITSAEGGQWYVRDLGTRVGTTYLMTAAEPEGPGQVIVGAKPRRILAGDTIVIGWTKIVWPGRIMGAHPSSKDAPEFVLRPPLGWMNRVDELLVHHAAVDHHNSYLGEALANLLRSWWDGVDTGTDGKSPEWWGPRDRDEASGVTAPYVAEGGADRG